MPATANPTYRERYAEFLLRWAKVRPALPANYAALAAHQLRQRGVYGVSADSLYRFKHSGNMPENEVVTEIMEQLAKEYHADKILPDKAARKFLRTWEQRPGRTPKAAQLAAA